MRSRVFALLAALVIVLVGTVVWLNRDHRADGDKALTVVSFGGAYQAAQKQAYMLPFAEKTGARITAGEYNGDYGVLYARATSQDGAWDVVSVESAPALRGEREGIFEPLPADLTKGLPLAPTALRKAAVGHLLFSTVLGYRTDGAGPHPQSWADFFNEKRFPGKRGLRNNPRGTLEIALLADGVAPEKLYPLDVERALRKLDTIRANTVFWESGAQPVQLLANKTVDMTSVYNGRIWDGRVVEKLPLGWSLQQGLLEIEYWAVPKNAPHKALAFDFVRFSLERDQQAKFANIIAYVPANLAALPLVASKVREALPDPSSSGGQVRVDADWWAANEATVSARWDTWVGKK